MNLAMTATHPITESSRRRVRRFVDSFIRSEYVQDWTAEKDSDFINEPDRAARCCDAAEDGCDGKTHAEVIEDWRESFDTWLKYDGRRGKEFPWLFSDAVHAEFDATEMNLDAMGILWQQIG
jgi:hypothetical protein